MKKAILLSMLVPMLALAGEPAPAAPTPDAPTSSPTPEAAAEAAKQAAANPLANAVLARTPEEQAAQSGFQFSIVLDHYVGMGTFVDPHYYAYLSALLTIAPQYIFSIGKQKLVASLTVRGTYEYTLPDNETGRRWGLYDSRLGLSAPALFKERLTGIAFSPNVGLVIPTSPESWNAGYITSLSVGLGASKSISTVDFRASIGGSRAFYGQPASGLRNPNRTGTGTTPRDSNGNLLSVCRNSETLCGAAGMNTAWAVSAGGQVQWRATGSLALLVGYTYIHFWREAADGGLNDGLTSATLTGNGSAAAHPGYGQSDRTIMFVDASYQLNEHYSLDLGLYTAQTPLFIDKDGVQRVRFPLLSFGSWADNATSIYFSLSAAY